MTQGDQVPGGTDTADPQAPAATGPDEQPSQVLGFEPPQVPAGVLTLMTVGSACAVAIAEIDRLTAGLRDAEDRSVSLLALVGPHRLWNWGPSGGEAFGRLHQGALLAGVGLRSWLLVFVLLQLIALGCAVLLARRALPSGESSAATKYVLPLAAAVWVIVDSLVLLLAFIASSAGREASADSGDLTLGGGANVVAVVAGCVASVGWLLVLVVLFLVLRHLRAQGDAGQFRLAARAVYVQRFSLFVALIIGGLVVLPGGEILDQFPDAVRGWTDPGASHAKDAVVGIGALVLLTVVVLLVGRLRSTWVWNRWVRLDTRPEPGPAVYRWWLLVPVLSLGLALVVVVGDLGEVDLPVLLGFAGAIAAVPALSWAVKQVRPQWLPGPVPALTEAEMPYARLVWATGDIAAISLVAIAGLGLVRAYTAPAVLGFGLASVVVLVLGFVVAGGAWLAGAGLLARLRKQGEDGSEHLFQPDSPAGLGTETAVALGVIAALGLLGLLLWPLTAATWLGVVGMTTISLGCLTVLVSLVVLGVQQTEPLPIFTLLRLQRTPVLTLLILVLFVASLGGGDVDVHRVRGIADPAPGAIEAGERPTLEAAFDTWLAQPGGCRGSAQVAGHPVRPLILVAAAGGGIRAAVWTAHGVDRLAEHCGEHPVFLSSGVSGGSVGLALARDGGYVEAAQRLAEPGGLAAAIDGLVVRDLLASTTGIRVNDREETPQDGWLDRAGLMERRWETKASVMGDAFLGGASGDSGHLLLNSTSVNTACRMIVSDLRLTQDQDSYADRPEATPGSDQDPDCHSAGSGLPAGSVDLLSAYSRCLAPLRNGTAAMLSARFPYVTPSGVIEECQGLTKQQLVDGGYAEASGLGTVVDLGPELMRLVRRHNLEVLTGENTASLVVPTVVFLQNHFGTDLSAPPSAASSELLVPPVAARAKSEMGGDAALRQRTYAQFADPFPCSGSSSCPSAEDSGIPPLVVVAPATQPSVTAPLGWTLSERSITRLSEAMTLQAGAGAQASACALPHPAGQPDRLCDLFAVIAR